MVAWLHKNICDFGPFLRWCPVWGATGALVGASLSAAVCAQTWGGSINVVNERLARGVALSDGEPGATLDVFYRDDRNWALGLGLGSMKQTSGARAEVIASATRWWQLDDQRTLTLSLAHYGYADGPRTRQLRYSELSVGGLWDGATLGQWGATLSLSPDLGVGRDTRFEARGGASIVELTWHKRLGGTLAADVGWGLVAGWHGESYRFSNVGLSLGWQDWRFSLSRLTTTLVPQQRWVAGMAWSF